MIANIVMVKKDFKVIFFRFGVAVALSFAAFLFDRFRTRKRISGHPPPRPRSLDHDNDVDAGGGRACRRDNIHVVRTTSSCENITSVSVERHENAHVPRVSTDNPTVGLSPSSKHNRDRDGYHLEEFDDLVKEIDIAATSSALSPKKDADTPTSDMGTPRAFRSSDRDDYEREIKNLKNMVRLLGEREKNLEVQLLEFYGHKEQETAVLELQNCLKINNIEVKYLTLKMDSLQSDNQRLQAQVADHARTVAELDSARVKVKLLKKKLRHEVEQSKEQLLALQKRVSRLHELEHKSAAVDSDVQLKLQKLKDLECEAEDLRKSNIRLHLENSELSRQLECTQVLANSVLEDPEAEALREHCKRLREENENLASEVERLQGERCTDVEELVYIRWINACLRYELRTYQPPPGKTIARDLSKSLSPRSEEKAKQLILEYANADGMPDKDLSVVDFESDRWSTSQVSSTADSLDNEEGSVSSKPKHLKRIKIFKKLRKLLHGKEDDSHHQCESPRDRNNMGSEYPDSSHRSFSNSIVTEAVSDLQSNRYQIPSLSSSRQSSRQSSRHSWDAKADYKKDAENAHGNSDVMSSYGYKRVSFSIGSSNCSPEIKPNSELYSPEKLELVKFAEVLKDSPRNSTDDFNSVTESLYKRSISLSEFDLRRRTTSN